MRILCITPWFPAWPGDQFGSFILDSLLAMKEQGHELATLVCHPWYPAWGGLLHDDWGRRSLRPDVHDPALAVSQLRYPSIPRNYCRSLNLWLFKRRVATPLRALITDFRPQLLLVHTEQMAMAATLVARPLGIPVVLVVHGINTSPRLNTMAERARVHDVLNLVDRVVLVGQPLWDAFTTLAGNTDKFRIVHNGMRLPSQDLNQSQAITQRPLAFISVSNLVEGKGIDINLEALARINEEGLQDWRYTVVGGGNQMESLKQSARRLGIQHKINFTGAIPHSAVYGQLVNASVFLLPSWQEAFGVAWLEAMACGLLTVAVAGQGPAAFIRHDETGLLVAPRNVDSVVACLHRIFAEPEALQLVAQQGQREVISEFTWMAHAKRLTQVCREVLVRK